MCIQILVILVLAVPSCFSERSAIYAYRYVVYKVKSCPTDQSEWIAAARKINCSDILSLDPTNRYHCIPDSNRSKLIEFCYDEIRPPVEKDNCVELAGTGTLDQVKCHSFEYGCPHNVYKSDEVFNYPSCLEIDTQHNCFLADPKCKIKRAESSKTADSLNITNINEHTTEVTNFTTAKRLSNGVPKSFSVLLKFLPTAFGVLMPIISFVIVAAVCRGKGERRDVEEGHPLLENEPTTKRQCHIIDEMFGDEAVWKTKSRDIFTKLKVNNRAALYSLLLMEQFSLKCDDMSSYLLATEKIQKLLNLQKKIDLDAFQDETIKQTDNLRTFASKDIRDETFWHFFHADNPGLTRLEFLLRNGSIDTLKLYVCSKEYQPVEGERCIRICEEYTETLIEQLDAHILDHKTLSDKNIIPIIAKKLNIPEEIIQKGRDAIEDLLKQMQKGYVPVYHARGLIVGCAKAGKTTLLKRLKNENQDEILNTQTTDGLEVHIDAFEVMDDTIIRKLMKNLKEVII